MEVMRHFVIAWERGTVPSVGTEKKQDHFIARMVLVVLKKKRYVMVKNNVTMAVMSFVKQWTAPKYIAKN